MAKTDPMPPQQTTTTTRASLGVPAQGSGIRRTATFPTSFSLLRRAQRTPLPPDPRSNKPGRQKARILQEIGHKLTQHLTRKNDHKYPGRELSKDCPSCRRDTCIVVTNTGSNDRKLVA